MLAPAVAIGVKPSIDGAWSEGMSWIVVVSLALALTLTLTLTLVVHVCGDVGWLRVLVVVCMCMLEIVCVMGLRV